MSCYCGPDILLMDLIKLIISEESGSFRKIRVSHCNNREFEMLSFMDLLL